jgi:hypothetical protein
MKIKLLVCVVLLLISTAVRAQSDRCGTVHFNNLQHNKTERYIRVDQFERWMKEKRKSRLTPFNQSDSVTVYRIPVVVHVIHNGDPEGTGSNVPAEQILSQINVLNEDFRRSNADTVLTPSIFRPVAADTRIEFVLARQDPNGLPTNGINRVNGFEQTGKRSWRINEGQQLSNLSYWPANDYMNLWVANLSGSLIGYAQFPQAVNGDPAGLEDAVNNPSTDGVVIDYEYFGSGGSAAPVSKGRTATHEVGHFLGLRHIWGDDNACGASDFCEDTPPQETSSEGCPGSSFSCGTEDMFQNYMDYTIDECMNIFTRSQQERMRIILENSPRRKSLLVSPGLQDPAGRSDDMGIVAIEEPSATVCDLPVTPRLLVQNFGNNTVNNFNILLTLPDGKQQNVFVETAEPLDSGQQASVSFNPLELGTSFNQNVQYTLQFNVTETNGREDNNPFNNEAFVNFNVPLRTQLPLIDDFEGSSFLLDSGTLENNDRGITWNRVSLSENGQPNEALRLRFYNYLRRGASDVLRSPLFSFDQLINAKLSFRYAYAVYDSNSPDELRVSLSTGCGDTVTTLFSAAGSQLATVPNTTEPFVPNKSSDWRTLTIPLNKFIGSQNMQLIFEGINANGNNLYLDDVELRVRELKPVDVGIRRIVSPSVITCNSTLTPSFFLQNLGSETVTSVQVEYDITGSTSGGSFNLSFAPVVRGDSVELALPEINIPDGSYTLQLNLRNPNELTDGNSSDNSAATTFTVNSDTEAIPFISTFNRVDSSFLNSRSLFGEEPATVNWQVVNIDQQNTWSFVDAPGNGFNNQAVSINYTSDENIGAEDWLVSPILNFSNLQSAAIAFKRSYALPGNITGNDDVDTLEIRVSTSCNQGFRTIYQKSGAELNVRNVADLPWVPEDKEDWVVDLVDLDDFTGNAEVRIAFVAINGSGSTIYLDDIELFVQNEDIIASYFNQEDGRFLEENNFRIFPNHPQGVNFNPKIRFNLLQREQVNLFVYDSRGVKVQSRILPNVLNQVYDLEVQGLKSGLYYVKAIGNSINQTQRFYFP